ncbi:MAG: Multidrug resistance protein MdtA [Holosporales bacterium]
MDIKAIFKRLQEQGVLVMIAVVLAVFLVLMIILKLLERPTKSFCEYLLREERSLTSREDRIVPVEVCIAEMKPMVKRISTTGNLRANESVGLRCELPNAKIKTIHFEQGSKVEKGALLIEFEDDDYKAKVSRAKAQLELREMEFKRISQLFEQKVESQKKYDEAKAGLSAATAELEEAEANLKKTKIYAPFQGTAGLVDYSVGATIPSNQDLFKLVDETPMKVIFSIPETYVHDVGMGQTIDVKVDAFDKKIFSGVIEAVDSAITKETHSLNVRGSLPNAEGLLREGLFCHIDVVTGEQGDVLQIDETAIRLYQDKEIVLYVEKGRVRPAQVITGYHENGKVQIKAGLMPGMIVVTAGQAYGQNEKVKITNLTEDALQTKVALAQGKDPKAEKEKIEKEKAAAEALTKNVPQEKKEDVKEEKKPDETAPKKEEAEAPEQDKAETKSDVECEKDVAPNDAAKEG